MRHLYGHSTSIAIEHDTILTNNRRTLIEVAPFREVGRTQIISHLAYLLAHRRALAVTRLQLLRIGFIRRHCFRIMRGNDLLGRDNAIAHADFLAAVRDNSSLLARTPSDRLTHRRHFCLAVLLLVCYTRGRKAHFFGRTRSVGSRCRACEVSCIV